MIEERSYVVMAHHLHDALETILPKCFRKGVPIGSRNPSPERRGTYKPREPPLTQPPTPSDFKFNDKYTHLKDFDAGEEGQCSVVKSQSNGRVYVRKHTRAPSPSARRRPAHLSPPHPSTTGRRKALPPEARILTHLQPIHPNIIRYFAVETSPHGIEQYNIYLELCSGGDLLDQLRCFRDQSTRSGPTAPVVFTLHVLTSLAHALAYLHHGLRWKEGTNYTESKPWEAIIHGDIKPDNVFLRHSPRAQVKGLPDIVLGDFGMAQFASQSTGITGTPGYDSPEVRQVATLRETNPFLYAEKCKTRIMTPKSDVYQLGLTLYLMAVGRHFKVRADPKDIQLCEDYRGVTGFVALLVWCLQPEADDRPECTNDVVEGCLFAVDVMMRRRDGVIADGGLDTLRGRWSIVELDNQKRRP